MFTENMTMIVHDFKSNQSLLEAEGHANDVSRACFKSDPNDITRCFVNNTGIARGPVRTLLYIDGRMLGFGILVDDKILCHRLRVENVDSIVDADWTELSLPVPTSTVSDRRGAYLTYLLESPVLMSLPRSARFFYCMVAQWFKRFEARCRLVGGPDDFVLAPHDLLHTCRRYSLDEFAAVVGKRYQHNVPNIAAWKHRESTWRFPGLGFRCVDSDGVIHEIQEKPANHEKPERAVDLKQTEPNLDLYTQRQFEMRSRGGKTARREVEHLNLMKIISVLRERPFSSVEEVSESTGISVKRVRDHLNKNTFPKRLRKGTMRTFEYENSEKHKALLDKGLRSIGT
jgi:predicted DNA-binding transcriptional regulator AlpA